MTLHARTGSIIGVGPDCVIRDAIIDTDVRIGAGSRLVNSDGVWEADGDGWFIRDGVIPDVTLVPYRWPSLKRVVTILKSSVGAPYWTVGEIDRFDRAFREVCSSSFLRARPSQRRLRGWG